MSETETLDQHIERLEAELTAAKAERDSPKAWKPERGETYVCLSAAGPMWQAWSGADADAERYERGNVFRTWEEAEREDARRILIAEMRMWCNERGYGFGLEPVALRDYGYGPMPTLINLSNIFADRFHLLSDEAAQ